MKLTLVTNVVTVSVLKGKWPIFLTNFKYLACQTVYEESPPRSRILLYDLSLFWVTSHVSPELLSRAKILIWRNQTLGKLTGQRNWPIMVLGRIYGHSNFGHKFCQKYSYLQCVSRVLSSEYKVRSGSDCLNGLNCVIRR